MAKARRFQMIRENPVIIWLLLLVLLYVGAPGWSSYKRNDIDKKLAHATRQCDQYGGYTGEIPIETEGVYDHRKRTRSPQILDRASMYINRGLSFVEFDADIVFLSAGEEFRRGGGYYRTGSTVFRYYRVYISEVGDPLCQPFLSLREKGEDSFRAAGLRVDQCIAVEGFDDPSKIKAKYELVLKEEVIDDGIAINWYSLQALRRETQTVVASYNFFSHCLTKMKRHRSEGFKYCKGSYSNPEIWPTCPGDTTAVSSGIDYFEENAFISRKG